MMKPSVKRKTPYQYLLEDVKEFARKINDRGERIMWRYPKDRLGGHWTLSDLYQRTAAANQVGYDVQLVADEEGLTVVYVKQVPHVPFKWRE